MTPAGVRRPPFSVAALARRRLRRSLARRTRALALAVALLAPALAAGQTTLPRVHVIATGGTISNLGNDQRRTGAELVAGIGDLSKMADVTVEQFSNVVSGAITHEMWRALAKRIVDVSAEPRAPAGFVITHGTDTMEETAYFLDLTLGGCAPVILTGAMRQASAVGADGPANLRNAIRVAVAPAARGRGTLLLMNDEIFEARSVTKSNTTRINAFTAPEGGEAGVADPDTVIFYRHAEETCRPAQFDLTKLAAFPRVDIVYAYIGADSLLVDALVAAGAKGLVLAGVGRGGATPSLSRALQRATERGVMVAVSNRTGSGRVGDRQGPDSLGALPPGRGAMVGAGGLNPQKARILLMLALAAGMDVRAIGELFGRQ